MITTENIQILVDNAAHRKMFLEEKQLIAKQIYDKLTDQLEDADEEYKDLVSVLGDLKNWGFKKP